MFQPRLLIALVAGDFGEEVWTRCHSHLKSIAQSSPFVRLSTFADWTEWRLKIRGERL